MRTWAWITRARALIPPSCPHSLDPLYPRGHRFIPEAAVLAQDTHLAVGTGRASPKGMHPRSARSRSAILLALTAVATFGPGCGTSDFGQNGSNVTEHEHPEVSYEKIFRPVIDNLATTQSFGPRIKQGFEAVTQFARTDFAHSTCLDSPEAWGLEISAGGNIGVGYAQGIEMTFEGGNLHMNCLNQLDISPELSVGTSVNLIRHVGECEAEGENLEDTLFVELATGVNTSLGVTLELGVAYTAGLRKGLLNRALPTFLQRSYTNWFGVVDEITTGKPVFDELKDPNEQDALCATTAELFSESNALVGSGAVHAQKLNAFLKTYLETNTRCEGAIGEVVAAPEAELQQSADLHEWTVCTDVSLKGTVGAIRSRIAERRATTEGLAGQALGQLDAITGLLEDVFSGCDHIEFQMGSGVGVAAPITAGTGLESHNYYGTLSFDGTEEELALVLTDILQDDGFQKPVNLAESYVGSCEAINDLPLIGSFLDYMGSESVCDVFEVSGRTAGFVNALRNDERFDAEFASSLDLWGYSLQLPKDPLLNYAVNCSLGPLRNAMELLYFEPEASSTEKDAAPSP